MGYSNYLPQNQKVFPTAEEVAAQMSRPAASAERG